MQNKLPASTMATIMGKDTLTMVGVAGGVANKMPGMDKGMVAKGVAAKGVAAKGVATKGVAAKGVAT